MLTIRILAIALGLLAFSAVSMCPSTVRAGNVACGGKVC